MFYTFIKHNNKSEYIIYLHVYTLTIYVLINYSNITRCITRYIIA